MSVILFPHFTRLIYGFVAAVIIFNDQEFSINGDIVFNVVNPFPSKGFPIEE